MGVNLSANIGTTNFGTLTVTTTNGFALNTNNVGTVNSSGGSLTQSGAGGSTSGGKGFGLEVSGLTGSPGIISSSSGCERSICGLWLIICFVFLCGFRNG